jgi:hypothetical protein
MGINERTMRRTMGNNEKYNGITTSGCSRGKEAMGEISHASKAKRARSERSGRANVTLHLMPCATRAANASGIESLPAIQGAPLSDAKSPAAAAA